MKGLLSFNRTYQSIRTVTGTSYSADGLCTMPGCMTMADKAYWLSYNLLVTSYQAHFQIKMDGCHSKSTDLFNFISLSHLIQLVHSFSINCNKRCSLSGSHTSMAPEKIFECQKRISKTRSLRSLSWKVHESFGEWNS